MLSTKNLHREKNNSDAGGDSVVVVFVSDFGGDGVLAGVVMAPRMRITTLKKPSILSMAGMGPPKIGGIKTQDKPPPKPKESKAVSQGKSTAITSLVSTFSTVNAIVLPNWKDTDGRKYHLLSKDYLPDQYELMKKIGFDPTKQCAILVLINRKIESQRTFPSVTDDYKITLMDYMTGQQKTFDVESHPPPQFYPGRATGVFFVPKMA
jgi:hypothetical protein